MSPDKSPARVALLVVPWIALHVGLAPPLLGEESEEGGFEPEIPRTWDEEALEDLEVPLAQPEHSPEHVSADYYYRIPVRPIYKSYPVYHPDREPEGYLQRLQKKEPEVIWDDEGNRPELKTRQDWIEAGEIVFDAAIGFTDNGMMVPSDLDKMVVRDRQWYEEVDPPLTKEGKLPFYRYVIREKGEVELGVLSCAMCHTRVMDDGTVLKGAQGNFPFDKTLAYGYRQKPQRPQAARGLERFLYAAPWIENDHQDGLDQMSVDEIAAPHGRIPRGVLARHESDVVHPVKVPSLIGVEDLTCPHG